MPVGRVLGAPHKGLAAVAQAQQRAAVFGGEGHQEGHQCPGLVEKGVDLVLGIVRQGAGHAVPAHAESPYP